MAISQGKQQWHASYWKEEKHGQAWERASEAMKRDWEQTKADFGSKSGKELNQDVDDTVKQAFGKDPIPGPNTPNPSAPNASRSDKSFGNWSEVEPAYQYGFGARQEYGSKYNQWSDELETQLSKEWDPSKTGKPFDDVKPYVRRGYERK